MARHVAGGPAARTCASASRNSTFEPEIAAAVAAGNARQLAAADIRAAGALEELRRVAFSDPSGCFDAEGNLLPLADMPPARAAVASVKVVKRKLKAGDWRADEVHEVRFRDTSRSLEQLAKHFGLFVERIEPQVSVDLVGRMQAARLRGKR
jgi:hypothetical protein